MPDKGNFGAVLQPVVGALCADDAKHIGSQYVNQDKCVVQPVPIQDGREMEKAQNGIGIGQQGDPAYTLDQTGAQAVAFPIDGRNAMRDPDKLDEMNRQGMGVGDGGDPSHTVTSACVHAVAHAFYSTGRTHGVNQHPEVSPAVKVGSGLGIPSPPAVAQAMTVRRLTPRECERLQGFPDDWTLIPWRKKSANECPDGPRYRALGNSMAVNCMEWIGQRIVDYEAR